MSLVHSFEPVVGRNPRVIILGSMPGVISLQSVQYYAHPRNIFWPILAELFSIKIDCSYQERVQQVSDLPLILWDTLKSCDRNGSLDSSILKSDLEANDICSLLKRYSTIKAIAFNGAASEKYFKQLVKPQLTEYSALTLMKMPSTSPANAGMKFDQKLELWKRLLDFL